MQGNVIQRDYRDSGNSIIKIYDDRIEFFNPGKRASEMAIAFKLTQRTIERWLKQLKENIEVEFRGYLKTGGYFAN